MDTAKFEEAIRAANFNALAQYAKLLVKIGVRELKIHKVLLLQLS